MSKLKKTAQVFNPMASVAPLGIIAMDGAKELGEKINDYIVTCRHLPQSHKVPKIPVGRC